MEIDIPLTEDRFLKISTRKGGSGVIQTTAMSFKRFAQEGSVYVTDEFRVYQDLCVRLESSNVGRVTQKRVEEQHARHTNPEKVEEYVSMAKEFYNLV